MESKWPQRTCREAVNDIFVQEKFKPPVKTKIMMIEKSKSTTKAYVILKRIFQTKTISVRFKVQD